MSLIQLSKVLIRRQLLVAAGVLSATGVVAAADPPGPPSAEVLKNTVPYVEGGGITKNGAGSYFTSVPVQGGPYGQPSYKRLFTENVKGQIPSSQWWSSLLVYGARELKEGPAGMHFSTPLYGHPLAIRYDEYGVTIYNPGPAIHATPAAIWAEMWEYSSDIVLGHSEVAKFAGAKVDAFSDWFVTGAMADGDKLLKVSFGHGSPYVYAYYAGGNATLTFAGDLKVWSGSANDNVLGVTINGRHYGLFGPTGATWTGLDKIPAPPADPKEKGTPCTFTCDLHGKGYMSLAALPDNKPETLALFKKHAYAFVTDTKVAWKFETPGKMTTTFSYTTKPMEGTDTDVLFALYPHQWKYSSTKTLAATYVSVRGTMKIGEGSSFTTEIPIQGVLPRLPDQGIIDAAKLAGYVKDQASKKGYPPALDTYDEGKLLGNLTSLAEEAEAAGDADSQTKFIGEMKKRLEGWFTAAPGKKDGIFFYDSLWGTMIGHRSSFGADVSLNDHHFHYGYFIRAAAEIARLDPEWAKKWGPMVNLLIRDIATPVRDDPMFPAFRAFDRYAGHCWASGDGIALDGCNQESSSESMNAWYAVTLWGQATGDIATRDLGMYIYNTEMTAIEEYWFDVSGTNYPKDFTRTGLGMVWGGKGAYGTWFSGNSDCIYGINWLPVTPGSVYLGRYPEYVKKHYEDTIATRQDGKNLNAGWGGHLIMFHATEDPADALKTINDTPGFKSDVPPFTYHWIGTFANLGRIDKSVTADYPLYNVFNKAGAKTYVIYNYEAKPLTVTFSDGTKVVTSQKGMTVQK